MNSNAEGVPGRDAQEVSQLKLGQISMEMWLCPLPSPPSLPVPVLCWGIGLRLRSLRSCRNKASPQLCPRGTVQVSVDIMEIWLLGGLHIFPIGCTNVHRFWANHVPLRHHENSIDGHIPYSYYAHPDRGKVWIGQSTKRLPSSQSSGLERKIFLPPLPTRFGFRVYFCRGLWEERLKS